MGEKNIPTLKPSFNRSIDIQAGENNVTADAGALAMREVMNLTGITSFIAGKMEDPRRQGNVRHPIQEGLRTSILLLAQGYTDLSDVGRFRNDPAFLFGQDRRKGVGPLGEDDELASQSTMTRLRERL